LQVVGGALSSEMLQRARHFTEAQSIELDLVQLDMRDFDLRGRTFDTIIVAMNSVLHLHSLEDFRAFFDRPRDLLSQDGRLVFDALPL
jgi:cyclopropane fatty-acyl-phospholipid synthase-like methyltransferase